VARGDRLELEAVLATAVPTFVPGSLPSSIRPGG
jgi:hypothetical protein